MLTVVPNGGITSPKGYRAGAIVANVKGVGGDKLDVGAFASDTPAVLAGVFTTNKVVAAPVLLSRQVVARGQAQAVVFNSGNANACTGEQGKRDARTMAEEAARLLGITPDAVLVASTGVIGVPMPMDRVQTGIRRLVLEPTGGHSTALAIMTTDTFSKEHAVQLQVGGVTVTIGGMAKGSGMIHPQMATLLGFMTTDAKLDAPFAQALLRDVADATFNMLSVDGDTSTNDTLLLLGNGMAGGPVLRGGDADSAAFAEAVMAVARELTIMLARDGEGATKVIEVHVGGAASTADARQAALAVIKSPLLKSAVYGADPNWGRIACATGYSGAALDQDALDVTMMGVPLLKAGTPLPFDKPAVTAIIRAAKHVLIAVDLHLGQGEATAWGCDLTEEYVHINGHYTT